MDKPLRILAIVNLPWDPRFGAARVWIEMAAEWSKAGHVVDKFCLTDAFPVATASPPLAALRLMMFPFRARKFVRRHAEKFDVIDALVGTLPFTKKSLRFEGLLVARSVGLFHLYEKFERTAAKRWPPPSKGKLLGRIFYSFFNKRARAASQASVRNCDLLNLPNSDELLCLRDEMKSAKAAVVLPYGLSPARRHPSRIRPLSVYRTAFDNRLRIISASMRLSLRMMSSDRTMHSRSPLSCTRAAKSPASGSKISFSENSLTDGRRFPDSSLFTSSRLDRMLVMVSSDCPIPATSLRASPLG